MEEEIESQDKTIDNLIEEQEEREKYVHSLENDKALQIQMNKRLIEEGIPRSVIQNKISELSKIKGDLATHIAVTEKINVLYELLEERK